MAQLRIQGPAASRLKGKMGMEWNDLLATGPLLDDIVDIDDLWRGAGARRHQPVPPKAQLWHPTHLNFENSVTHQSQNVIFKKILVSRWSAAERAGLGGAPAAVEPRFETPGGRTCPTTPTGSGAPPIGSVLGRSWPPWAHCCGRLTPASSDDASEESKYQAFLRSTQYDSAIIGIGRKRKSFASNRANEKHIIITGRLRPIGGAAFGRPAGRGAGHGACGGAQTSFLG